MKMQFARWLVLGCLVGAAYATAEEIVRHWHQEPGNDGKPATGDM